MATLFTRIIDGEIPGRFVWEDDTCVSFLTIGPISKGHALVVPRAEVDEWTDADDDLLAHLNVVGKRIGNAQKAAFGAPRAGVIIAGFEIPHLHLHVIPVWGIGDFDFAKVDQNPDPDEMDEAAEQLRAALRDAGFGARVPDAARS